MSTFTQIKLFTDVDGYAKFREETIPLTEGTPALRLSTIFSVSGVQLRESPIGFCSQVHCTVAPMWNFILSGAMEVSLPNGSSRVFTAGEHFFAADTLPEGATFDSAIHGHKTRQIGNESLVTLFVKV